MTPTKYVQGGVNTVLVLIINLPGSSHWGELLLQPQGHTVGGHCMKPLRIRAVIFTLHTPSGGPVPC